MKNNDMITYNDRNPESIGALPISLIWIGTFILWPLWLGGLIIGAFRAGNSRSTSTWGNFWLHIGLSFVISFTLIVLLAAAGAGSTY